jgi:hypothetical protein
MVGQLSVAGSQFDPEGAAEQPGSPASTTLNGVKSQAQLPPSSLPAQRNVEVEAIETSAAPRAHVFKRRKKFRWLMIIFAWCGCR